MTRLGPESEFFTHVMEVVATAGCFFQNASVGSGLLNEVH